MSGWRLYSGVVAERNSWRDRATALEAEVASLRKRNEVLSQLYIEATSEPKCDECGGLGEVEREIHKIVGRKTKTVGTVKIACPKCSPTKETS